jgi:hypothetical protein
MIQYRSVYPKVLAFAVCKALHIQPPRVFVQVRDGKTGRFYTEAVEL